MKSPTLRGVGTRIYMEMTKLLCRMSPKTIEIDPIPESVATIVPDFDNATHKSEELNLSCYTSGPESKPNHYMNELLAQIRQAEKTIFIDHMYFHPNQELMQALIEATVRGVHITIVTNKAEENSPGTHRLYGELSRREARRLLRAAPQGKVDIFEYGIDQSTLHKKVVIFDGKTTLFGSANLGYRSLEGHSDYEINLKVESPQFAAQTQMILDEDTKITQKVTPSESQIPFAMDVAAFFQSLLKPLL